MPISVQVTRGLLTPAGKREVFPLVADALLKVHGLSGNRFMTPNVIGHVVVSPESESYVGGKSQSLAIVEVKVPGITFPDAEVKQGFVTAVTDIVDRLKAGSHPRERTFVNVSHAVDGTWGIGGKAYSNAELAAEISRG
jgi:phenylpyruvate tautomerase PptA (4-oxalocrotonate tautomerase family)